ncbi:MAG: magnesium chelatase, partial [Candidatus Dormibacteraeota bacterium]|nr:magnesium chelatase [Candidatus Dormibacteraeota bacterium]
MRATMQTALVRGVEGRAVEVQVDISQGVTGFFLVGLATGSAKEAKERVRSAIRAAGLPFPHNRLTVNLAPAELRKDGSGLDLAVAAGICLAQLGLRAPDGAAFLGELALDGGVRHVDGVLVLARWLASRGIRTLFVPEADAAEAALGQGPTILPCPDLGSVMAHLTGEAPLTAHSGRLPAPVTREPEWDLAEVQGQEAARRALEVAAGG